jgi:ferrochelatase
MTDPDERSPAPDSAYDAILLVSFGGPEGPDDVMPFLENVLRGRNVPRERMLEVSEHYNAFGGVSPINEQCRHLLAAMRENFAANGLDLPIYWGNRNWHPMLADTIGEMKADGVQRALAFVTASTGSYSSCRQYREDIEKAREVVGPGAPVIDKLRLFYNHPDFVDANGRGLAEAIAKIPEERRTDLRIAFTAHSIPVSMSDSSDYKQQLTELSGLVAAQNGYDSSHWDLVYQSRSGPPQVPWLDPDICDHLRSLKEGGTSDVIVMPIGFVSDHMEVLYDLDHEAADTCEEIGLQMVRARTVGTDAGFVSMIRKLILERIEGHSPASMGQFPAAPDFCRPGCCPAPRRPTRPAGGARPGGPPAP